MKTQTAESVRKQLEVIAASIWLAIQKAGSRVQMQFDVTAALKWLAAPACAVLAVGVVCRFCVTENYSGDGEPFAWFDGTSAGPSIAIILFAALLSVHFIVKAHLDLRQNLGELTDEFGLKNPTRLKPGTIDIVALWERYRRSGRFLMRVFRALPMTGLYMLALIVILPLLGDFPRTAIRGDFPFPVLMGFTICLFLFLTFFVIDAILLHEGFLIQLEKKETCWPNATFQKFHYSIEPERPHNESDLADYWDILLISKRTEAVGRVIYYPFIILSLLIVARLRCLYNWAWSPVLIVALSMHFSLALYAAWRLPRAARIYRDNVIERLKRRRRQALMVAQRTPEAIDTLIEEVQSTHKGAFSYLWEQPAIRALLLPSSGIGLATLLQYLPH
jgi:hypothetical protein